mmetsp:Transcript_8262/g.12706  ORF Transcript_8262/g.12706 Transcript_8262/m.12706 type:complete len:238 (+) Transcript_8262:176-889(+)|eukprot:CAMPEP_0178915928 /NCGR_PEP_ID=MMETSP0786-20121207/12324_1 /TAXON_ID=186022 /ORGANISM="Thalassionema frauenfeldii, Strain CCMP 1798" /LENGTH=237 /DNA_ID=CAMNT_0020589143 /DNA_START=130 /DNA_END=843 /DNA_ORIENTATION=+
MNHLAKPAPQVGAAIATDAPKVKEAKSQNADQVEAAKADSPSAVGPAVPFDPQKAAYHSKEAPIKTISVQALRGKTGADFESEVAVLEGAPKKDFLKRFLPLIFDERDYVSYGEVKRYVLIKGDSCFIFMDKDGTEPLYAISLADFMPMMEDPKNLDKYSVNISPVTASVGKEDLVTVLLKHHDDSQGFQFTFDTSIDRSVAKRFLDFCQRSSPSCKLGAIRSNGAIQDPKKRATKT